MLVAEQAGTSARLIHRDHVRIGRWALHRLLLAGYALYAVVAFFLLSEHQGPVGGYDDWGYFLKARSVRQWTSSDPAARESFSDLVTRASIHSPLHTLFYALLVRPVSQDSSPLQATSYRLIQLSQLFLSLLALWLTYHVALRVYSRHAALAALLVGMFSFPVISQSLMLLQHAISAVVLLLLLWVLLLTRRSPELSVILTTIAAAVLAGFRYGYVYFPPALLVVAVFAGARELKRRDYPRVRLVSFLVSVTACAAAITAATVWYRSYLARVDSQAYSKDLGYRIDRVVLDPRADACRWAPPSDTQTLTWAQHENRRNGSVAARLLAAAAWHCTKLHRLIEGNLNLRRACLWPFTGNVQKTLGVAAAFLGPLFLLSSVRFRRYEVFLATVATYLVGMELISVIETRRLYDITFVALPLLGAGVVTTVRGVARLRTGRDYVLVLAAAVVCLLCFTSLGRPVLAAHVHVRNVGIVLGLALVLFVWRRLAPSGLVYAHAGSATPISHPLPACSADFEDVSTSAARKSLAPRRWLAVGAYMACLSAGLLNSRVKELDWFRLLPGERISLAVAPALTERFTASDLSSARASVYIDLHTEAHRSSDPPEGYAVDVTVNGHRLSAQGVRRSALFHPLYDGRRECESAGLLSVLERHNAWHGRSWAAHRHWHRYPSIPIDWIVSPRPARPDSISWSSVTVTVANTGRYPLRLLRCFGDFSRPRSVYLPALVAADGSQFRRGSAYGGSRLDDWRIPYKYRLASTLRTQCLVGPSGRTFSLRSRYRYRYGVFVVLHTRDGRRFIL